MATPSTLIAHQTRGGAGSSWLYNPEYKRTMKKYQQPEEEEDRGPGRPDWIDNPPEGFVVASSEAGGLRSTTRTQAADRLRQLGAAGGSEYWTDPESGQTFALGKKEAAERPEESIFEEAMLDDYESPGVELEEEEEEAENLRDLFGNLAPRAIPPLRFGTDQLSPGPDPFLKYRDIYKERPTGQPSLETQLLQQGRTTPGLDALAEQARVANLPQAAIAESTDYRRRGARDTGYLYDQGERISREEAEEILGPEEIARVREEDELGLGAQQTPDLDRYRDIYRQRPTLATPTLATSGAGAAPDDEGGLLQMLAGLGGGIGGWAKENPELLMAGLQTIGELGGQYKRGRREQEASDAEAQERRMSGAISALTRGRVTPEVGRRVPRTTAGEGMFDVMAGIGRGGTQFLEAKRGREERERLEGMQDEEIARMRGLEDEELKRETEALAYQKIKDLRAQGLEDAAIKREIDRWRKDYELRAYEAKTGRIGEIARGLPGAAKGDISPETLKQIDQVLTRLEKHIENPKYGTTGGLSGLGPFEGAGMAEFAREYVPGAQVFDAVKNQEYFMAQTADIVFRVLKPLSKEGRLTQTDYDNLERMAGRFDMDKELQQDLLKDIRKSIELAQNTPPGTYPTWEDGGDPTWRGADQYSDAELLGLTDEQLDKLSPEQLDELEEVQVERGLLE